ncbi:hypothetical protein HFP57_02540 [Parasphingopyxis algicola]|uniref:hypothetical protein n=1 Tax=Parasphingopyxis algicola TaxID=2026624 RepID=UPI0015A0D3A2|nr:hypothetical protein [Parasphingopyxis algicola]QLC24019.1 hypothetical protein HFP57_02540 [Parasphingopyxis algicola]
MTMRSPLPFAILLLASCAGPEGEAPSLTPRPIEGILDEPVRAIAPVASANDAALAAEIDALVREAEAGDRAFSQAYPAAQDAVAAAAGSSLESEAWIGAQLAVSALDSTRTDTTRALGSLDAILAEQATTGEPAETERLLAARERVAALYEAQVRRYEALNGRLRTQ